eukprot:989893-Pelagomonas_calceolata.AAC.1
MIIKALSKSPLGAGLVNTDIGSDRLAQHNLQISARASNRVISPSSNWGSLWTPSVGFNGWLVP